MKNKTLGIAVALLISVLSSQAQKTGSLTDVRDGKVHKTVKIGTQTWMAENLAYKAASGCWAYNDDTSNTAIYGFLYNWETAKVVSPKGWHLPSDADWNKLSAYIGGDSISGRKLKEADTTHWEAPNKSATNETGFSALPGGARYSDGKFSDEGFNCYFWSSSLKLKQTAYAWHRKVSFDYPDLERHVESNSCGFSVRCIKD